MPLQLVRLQLDPARAKMIAVFVDSYLQLNALEAGKCEQELAKLTEDEQEATMECLTSWEKKGMQKGVESLLTRQLRRRLGELPTTAQAKIDQLSLDQMEDLGEALLDFTSQADLDRWLSVH